MVDQILPIIESLRDAAQGELTINQLAKVLKKSYGYTNMHVHDLASRDILIKREVGSALLCSLNYKTEETLGLLVLASIRKKREYLGSLSAKELSTINKALSAVVSAQTIYLHKQTLTAVTDSPAPHGERITTITTRDFARHARSIDMKNTIILQNHEAFWNAIAQQKP